MKINFDKKSQSLKENKLKFSYKSLIYETLELYKENFFLIFFNFLLYYILSEWLKQLAKNYTEIYTIFENFVKSLQSINRIEELQIVNFNFFNNLISHPHFVPYLLLFFLIEFLLFPLLIGIYKICFQSDKNKKVEFKSIFIGYQGNNFFHFIGLSIIYTILKFLFLALFFFPFILFFGFSMLAAPLMLFHKLSIKDSLKLSYKISRTHFFEVCFFLFLIGLFSISGLLLYFFGLYITIPIFYVGIYVLYKKLIGLENIKII